MLETRPIVLDSKNNKIISAHEKIMVVNFFSDFISEYGNLENISSALNNFIKEDYGQNYNFDRDIFSVTDLSRYINGKALPTDERKNFLLRFILNKIDPVLLIAKYIIGMRINGHYYVNTSVLISNLTLLEKLAFIVARTYLHKKNFDKILASSYDGVPFSLILAQELHIPIIYAKYDPPMGIESYLCEDIEIFEQKRVQSIYLQKNSIEPNDRILIIDDIIRTARTHQKLVNMIEECKGIADTILGIVGVGDNYIINSNGNNPSPELIILDQL